MKRRVCARWRMAGVVRRVRVEVRARWAHRVAESQRVLVRAQTWRRTRTRRLRMHSSAAAAAGGLVCVSPCSSPLSSRRNSTQGKERYRWQLSIFIEIHCWIYWVFYTYARESIIYNESDRRPEEYHRLPYMDMPQSGISGVASIRWHGPGQGWYNTWLFS